MVHVDIIQAQISACLLHVDVVDLTSVQELLMVCGVLHLRPVY